MKTLPVIGMLFAILLCSGCVDREAEKADAEAKARAEAARREMDAVPKTFKSRDYLKKNEPEKKPESATTEKKSSP